MKILRLAFIFLIEFCHANAQIPSWEWAHSTGGSGTAIISNGLAVDSHGNYYLSGAFRGVMTFGVDSLSNSNTSYDDYFISKYDAAGNVLWVKEFLPQAGIADYPSIIVGPDDDLCITGNFYTSYIIFDSDTIFGMSNTSNTFIIKIDTSGNLLWSRSSGGTRPWAICSDVENNVYVTGEFGHDFTVFGTDTIINADSTQGSSTFLVKYDANGNVKWAESFSGTSFNSMCTDKQENIYLTGTIQFYAIWGNDTVFGNGAINVFTGKLNKSGSPVWAKSAGGTQTDEGLGIVIDSISNVYLAGVFTSPAFIYGNDTIFQNRSSWGTDILIMKYDSAGNVQWAKTPGGRYEDKANAIASDPNGNVYLVGQFDTDTLIFGEDTITNPYGYWDIFIAKYDPQGNTMWVKTTGGIGDIVTTAATFSNGSLYVAGRNTCPEVVFDFDSISNIGQNIFAAKLGTYPTGIASVSPASPISVYPNPSTGSFYFSGMTEGSTIEVYDMMGQKINTTSPQPSPKGEEATAIVLSGRAAGVYFYRVSDQNNTIQTGKLVVE